MIPVFIFLIFCIVIGLISGIVDFVGSLLSEFTNFLMRKLKKVSNKIDEENAINDLLAIKIYNSNVDLYGSLEDKENIEKINALKKMCNTQDINKLRKLYNRAEKMIEETKREDYTTYLKAKEKSLIDIKHKYSSKVLRARLTDEDTMKIFKLFKFENTRVLLQENKNIIAEFNIKLKKIPKILNSKAKIDGSLKVSILNLNNDLIAEGYCLGSGFGYDNWKDDLEVGFSAGKYQTLCVSTSDKTLNVKDKGRIEIKPVKLWLIEESLYNTNSVNYKSDNTNNTKPIIKNDDADNIVNENEKYYCERCYKEIPFQTYEVCDMMCEECYDDVHTDENGKFHDDKNFNM